MGHMGSRCVSQKTLENITRVRRRFGQARINWGLLLGTIARLVTAISGYAILALFLLLLSTAARRPTRFPRPDTELTDTLTEDTHKAFHSSFYIDLFDTFWALAILTETAVAVLQARASSARPPE